MVPEKEKLRTLTCFRCSHRGASDGTAKRCFCEVTKRWGDVVRGYYCAKFERLEKSSCDLEFDGFPRRNLQLEDYRTARQWEEAGRGVNQDAKGRRMYANGSSSRTFVYYLPEETHECSDDDMKLSRGLDE